MSNTTTPPNVDVTAANPLTITDIYRSFGTVTIHPGGQITIMTSAPVSIVSLVKLYS
ncbi:hypothetical protein [Janthinobacterium sp. HLX7-2]|uniref:hypothetical protein n=1 Tax=Janthinobacterium sp. HLX7-2 TaxID=1259331 RepID=UPI003F20CE4A